MTILGNIFVALLGLGALVMFRFASGSTERYDYIVAGFFSLLFLVCFFALLAALTSTGKLDFLRWPRPLQYLGVALVSLSLTVLMGLSAALHGSGGAEFPWSIRPFCPWAAYMIPLLIALIGFLWLNGPRFDIPPSLPRLAFGVIAATALLSNIGLGVDIRLALQRQETERERNARLVIQETDPEKDFSRILRYTSRYERPAIRQLALQKILATGPHFNALMTDCLRTPVFEEGLTYLRDNDPPGDPAPLAEPARDALPQMAQRLSNEVATGRPFEAKDVEHRVDSVLAVADKFSKYGIDFLPGVRDCRAALDAPKSVHIPGSILKKLDAWLAAHSK